MFGLLKAIADSFDKSRKGVIYLMSCIIGICIFGAVVVGVLWIVDQNELKDSGQPMFNSLPQDQLKDELIVKGVVNSTVGAYVEYYDDYLNQGTLQVSDSRHYLIPVVVTNADGTPELSYFITLEVEPEDYKTMEKIEQQTWSDETGVTELYIDNAIILDLHEDYKKQLDIFLASHGFYKGGTFIDFCAETNILGTDDAKEIRSRIVPYLIRETETAGTSLTTAWVFIGIAILALGVLLIMKYRKKPIKGLDGTADKGLIQLKNEDEEWQQWL